MHRSMRIRTNWGAAHTGWGAMFLKGKKRLMLVFWKKKKESEEYLDKNVLFFPDV